MSFTALVIKFSSLVMKSETAMAAALSLLLPTDFPTPWACDWGEDRYGPVAIISLQRRTPAITLDSAGGVFDGLAGNGATTGKQ